MSEIYRAIQASAGIFAEHTALIAGEKNYTYQDLLHAVDETAQMLSAQGITDQEVVAVYCERSDKLLITLLALLKIGAVYVPVSIGYPKKRLDAILRTARCSFLITELGVERTGIPASAPSGAVYILFTSGSTGSPKGVVTTADALLAELESCQQKIPFRHGQRVLVNYPLSKANALPASATS